MASDREQHDNQRPSPHDASDQHPLVASALVEQSAESTNLRDHDTRTLRALQALTDTALSTLSLEALLPELLERVRAVMQVDNVAILLLEADRQHLELSAADGLEEEVIGRVRIPVGAGFAGRIAAERAPLAVEDLSTYPVSNLFLRERLHSALGVPLLAGDRVLGVVHIGSVTRRRFTPADTTLLEQVAERIARAVERAQLFAAAEAARREAEERAAFLSTTLETFSDGLAITDAAGRLLYGNPAYSALLGATPTVGKANGDGGSPLPEHVPGRLPLLDVRDAQGQPLSPADLAFARALRGETLAGPTALEVQIRRLDGNEAFLSITGGPVRDAEGRLIGAVVAMRDVTERRRLEQQAHEAIRRANERTARLEAIFAAVTDGLFVYDADGHIIERNPAASAMLAAYAPPEAHESSVYERGRIIGGMRDATGRALSEEAWPQRRIATGEMLVGPSSAYVRMRRNDGSESYVNVSGAPLRDEEGRIVGSVCLYRDVTDRTELNAALQTRTQELETANARLRTLLDVLPVGVAITDANRETLEVNAAFRRIWGDLPAHSPGDYSAYHGWWAATGAAVRPEEWAMARTLTTGESIPGDEIEIETFTGERKVTITTAAPLRDASGAIVGGIVAMLDITEQKRRTERTREALEAFIAITRALVEAPDVSGERSLSDGDGNADGGEASAVAHRLAELTRGLLGCSRVSISAVEGEELRTRPVAVVGLSPDQERQWWAEQQALAGQPMGEGTTPDDRARLLAGEVVTFDLTRPPYQIPNDYGVTSILAAPMRTQGRIVGLLGLDFQDPGDEPHVYTAEEIAIAEGVARLGALVLERERLLGEREAARAEALALTEANRRMDEFLGIAGHELRTPLTTVKANLQLAVRRAQQAHRLERQSVPEGQSAGKHTDRDPLEQLLRLLDRAAVSVDRQERLVKDLLDISRISSGRLEYRMERHDLTPLVAEVVEEQRINTPNRTITLQTPDEPVMVRADADRLGQVLANYLTNALKYSASNHPVDVVLRREGATARVEVRDMGPGLTPAQQRHLFERFHRVKGIEVVSGSGVGLGLGLYISKTIVAQHGGRVGVTSEPGHGSTFWFELPLAKS